MKYFTASELKCQCAVAGCTKHGMDKDFMNIIDGIREEAGFPFPVNSGYRCPKHPIEAKKENGPGAHATGKAIDIAVSGEQALVLVALAMKHEIYRIGVNQKGSYESRFIHLDVCENYMTPALWSY